ncbi:engulfment and cell motility protein [Anaeramoeba flamelloides]|uniref:Engulfment and cell motility protein n=1 Tax=Anaeramoeba flamelloides TaxID=1746091 RepID=A0AAV8A034_9EUKA|nr:engulfment and cell motility protein [Anaeramoeba flamelloides]
MFSEETERIKKIRSKYRQPSVDIIMKLQLKKMTKGKMFIQVLKNGKIAHTFLKLNEDLKAVISGPNLRGPFKTILSVSNIGSVTKDRQQTKTKKLDQKLINFLFIINDKQKKPLLTFVAQNEKQFANWSDGFRYLIGKPIEESITQNAIDELIDVDTEIELFDSPKISPVLPPPPIDLNFKVKTTQFL